MQQNGRKLRVIVEVLVEPPELRVDGHVTEAEHRRGEDVRDARVHVVLEPGVVSHQLHALGADDLREVFPEQRERIELG